MKKMIVAMLLVVAALAVFTTGAVYAQAPRPAGPGLAGGEGPLHDYMVKAMAEALGISASDFETRRDAGQTAYQIALDLGISADKIPGLLQDARARALDAAVADGVITSQQAGFMKSRGAGMGSGTCNGTGQGMGRGGRWQQTTP